MPHFKITLAYDGTPFHGWQIQPGLKTVQGTLAEALHRIARERVLPQGSGRTDTGVHALGQVASVTLAAPIPAERLHRALNHCLPHSIRVLQVEEVPAEFHARHSARSKTYEYRIFPVHGPNAICPPTLAPFVWPCPWALDLERLNRAAKYVIGTYDFTALAAAPASPEDAPATYVRTVTESAWHEDGELIIYRVSANGFLHHMVRNLVGTLVQCGAGRRDADSVAVLIASRERARCGPTAPASGLFLVSVEYPATDAPPAPHVSAAEEEAVATES